MPALARFVLALGASALSASLLQAVDPPKTEAPKPLPKEVVAAWEKAGAEVGWGEVSEQGFVVFHPANQPAQAGWLPVCKMRGWRAGVLKELAQPETPFGLYLSHTTITDAGLTGTRAS
jgi:hypothetical protein